MHTETFVAELIVRAVTWILLVGTYQYGKSTLTVIKNNRPNYGLGGSNFDDLKEEQERNESITDKVQRKFWGFFALISITLFLIFEGGFFKSNDNEFFINLILFNTAFISGLVNALKAKKREKLKKQKQEKIENDEIWSNMKFDS